MFNSRLSVTPLRNATLQRHCVTPRGPPLAIRNPSPLLWIKIKIWIWIWIWTWIKTEIKTLIRTNNALVQSNLKSIGSPGSYAEWPARQTAVPPKPFTLTNIVCHGPTTVF